ncbi:cell wall-binding repeat-containing protein [Cellulomonas composti]|uniref:Peptidoglycan recognition protein family domain-containing protein n=1 Tax=Cellulomonas composti TaxID=266130 RepID=A0A511JBT2_9CELL|nr:cell wall-binding repeat-containing protein [Cellulomonas composti]GEL95163.1 hypothetical protein CCO02nite_18210 [Cellulomonas composti]
MRRRTLTAVVAALVTALVATPASAGADAGAAAVLDPTPVATSASATVPVAADSTSRTTSLPLAGIDRASLPDLSLPVEVEPSDGTLGPQSRLGTLAVLTPASTTAGFDVLGVTWSDQRADVTRVLVRTREAGTWSDWTPVDLDAEQPDAGTPEAATNRPGTEPMVRSGSDGLQVRVETATGAAPAGLAATLVDVGLEQAAREGTTLVPSESGLAPSRLAPSLVTRAQWHADESLRKPILWNSTIKAVVVHHTVNSNTYSQAQAPALVRGIYLYHIKGRGWSDVGYHFLVDRFGTVYEGRAGSIDKIPLGVHSGGFNTDTIGIAMIGDFTSYTPPDAALRSVAQVAAWKLATYGRDPLGTAILTAREGSTHPIRKPGWTGPLPTIMGHRDAGSTACPGQLLYNRLNLVRDYAAQQVQRAQARVATAAGPPGTPLVAEVYGVRSESWTATVRSVCDATVVRTLAGAGRGWAPVSWDQRLGDGTQAPAGVYEVQITHLGVTDSVFVEALPKGGSGGEACGIARWGGADRWATAAAIGRLAQRTSDEVVLVAGTQSSIVDGLVAAPFARWRSAPVLLSEQDALPAATVAEIKRRSPSTVWLVGGKGVLGPKLVKQLRKLGVDEVRRIAGADRYGTAAAVAARMPASSSAVVASGAQANLVDAATVGGAAAAREMPIVLTAPHNLPAVSRDVLTKRGVRDVTIVGGTGAVSDGVADALRSSLGADVRRLAGDDRYGTALATASAFAEKVGTARVTVANGADSSLIDSVTAGALGRLALIVPFTGDARVTAWLDKNAVTTVDVVGGAGVVPPSTVAEFARAMR